MASDLNNKVGAEIRATAFEGANESVGFAAGSPQFVPICFQINATASNRITSTPWLAREEHFLHHAIKHDRVGVI